MKLLHQSHSQNASVHQLTSSLDSTIDLFYDKITIMISNNSYGVFENSE